MIAPDIHVASASRARRRYAMAKKRQPIDDLIDALVWMQRKAKKKAVKRRRICRQVRVDMRV